MLMSIFLYRAFPKRYFRKWGIPERYVGIGNCILGYGAPGGKQEAAPRKENYIVRV